MALAQVYEHRELHEAKVTTLGGDKAYHQKKFVAGCRERQVAPHAACKKRVHVSGLDGRTTGRAGYRLSQKIRKRVEEIFGWMKTVGGLRRSRYRGVERTQAWAYFVALRVAYSLRASQLKCAPSRSPIWSALTGASTVARLKCLSRWRAWFLARIENNEN